MSPRLVTVAACGALTGLAGCGGSDSSDSKPKAAAPASAAASAVKIPIKDFKFVPQTVTVRTGAKVTWTNEDSAPHTAQTEGKGFDTGTLAKGATKTVTLSKAGSFKYFCAFHRFMTGTITVK